MNTIHVFNTNNYFGVDVFKSFKEGLKGLFSIFQTKVAVEPTYEEVLAQRKTVVQNELCSESHKLQKLYFDTHSSSVETTKKLASTKIKKILDGGAFDVAIVNLRQDLEDFLKTEPFIRKIEKKEIKILIGMLEKAEELALVGSLLGNATSKIEKEKFRQQLQKIAEKQLADLAVDEKLLIPFGYGNDGSFCRLNDGGHAIILEIIRKDIDCCQIRVINTGEGREYHFLLQVGEKYYPLLYTTTFSKLKDPKTLEGLTKFLSSTLMSKKLNINDIYTYFIQQFGSGDFDTQTSYSDQGDNGNCTHKSLQAWFHSHFGNCRCYHLFRAFRLKRTINEVSPFEDKDFLYKHPFLYYPKWIANFLGKEHWSFSIPKKDVNSLINYGRTILDHRNKKI